MTVYFELCFYRRVFYPKCLAGLRELCHCVNAVYFVFYSTAYNLFLSVRLSALLANKRVRSLDYALRQQALSKDVIIIIIISSFIIKSLSYATFTHTA